MDTQRYLLDDQFLLADSRIEEAVALEVEVGSAAVRVASEEAEVGSVADSAATLEEAAEEEGSAMGRVPQEVVSGMAETAAVASEGQMANRMTLRPMHQPDQEETVSANATAALEVVPVMKGEEGALEAAMIADLDGTVVGMAVRTTVTATGTETADVTTEIAAKTEEAGADTTGTNRESDHMKAIRATEGTLVAPGTSWKRSSTRLFRLFRQISALACCCKKLYAIC